MYCGSDQYGREAVVAVPLAISLLLNWMGMGALLAILFHLSSTFDLMASTHNAS